MKKVYIKPEISTEIIEVELPISASMFVSTDKTKTIDSPDDFLGKDRDTSDWGGLW